MDKSGIYYIFPMNLEPHEYTFPETATNENMVFAPRKYIIENKIPKENQILKDILNNKPYIPFGYINKGNNETRSIKDASELLKLSDRYILKTAIAKDSDNKIYAVITLGDSGIKVNGFKRFSKNFSDSQNIAKALWLKPLKETLIKENTGTKKGFCRPIPLNYEFFENIDGILMQNSITQMNYEKNKKVLVTFPIGNNESILMPPKEIYNYLRNKYSGKVTFFKNYLK